MVWAVIGMGIELVSENRLVLSCLFMIYPYQSHI